MLRKKEILPLRLPSFEYLEPENLEEVLEFLAVNGEKARVIAGGTDLIVRMKQRLVEPAFLISLKNLQELSFTRQDNGVAAIGTMTPLSSLLDSDLIKANFPALLQALKLIGAPPVQHFRGTIGGNLCLQTRCLYYNQSALWRSGRTRCHKDNGETCYAEENSDRCRSANQSDGACALMALGAKVILASTRGKRILPMEEFFTGKGENPFAADPDEMVTEIHVPLTAKGQGSSFQKRTYRSALDFALVSAAASLAVDKGKITDARIAIGGAGASPLLLKEAAGILIGKKHEDAGSIHETADQVQKHASAFMVDNLGATLEYRQKMSGVMAKRAIKEALERAKS
jgi:4-hydroxybenzoyl-CoA reductase beta subunit